MRRALIPTLSAIGLAALALVAAPAGGPAGAAEPEPESEGEGEGEGGGGEASTLWQGGAGCGGVEPGALSEPRHRQRRRPRRPRPEQQEAPPADSPAPPAAAASSVHLALGTPTDADPSDDWLMIKPQYALSYNPKRNGANWVSWELNEAYFGGQPRHKGHFLTDDSLPAGFLRVEHRDYSGSDYDRGHLVRSEERTRSREDNDSTFLLTNILPQRHDLNAGPWLRLEEYCQTLAQRGHKEMFLVAGPVYGAKLETIGRGVAVPSFLYKIVVVLERGQGPADVGPGTRVIGVIMPNSSGILGEPWGRYRTSVAEVERRTGYRFLDRVPEPTRGALLARVDAGPTG